ncbi:MAG: helix-turn-helix domain-containing protein [Rhodoferax sp.]
MDKTRQKYIAAALGGRIARMRADRNLTQEQVAQRLDMGNEAISRIERGVVLPPLVRVFELAELFGCRIDELLMDASDRSADQAAAIAIYLQPLSPCDRDLVLTIVRLLSERLGTRCKRRHGKAAPQAD